MRESWYDTAQICWNGHIVNPAATSYPAMNASFCALCGAVVLTACPYCRTPIRGEYHLSDVVPAGPFVRPNYCDSCGLPYPWTQDRIRAAEELADELDALTDAERELLKGSIRELARDTPRTRLAVSRFRRLVDKVGPGALESFREILVDILSEAVKRAIWGQ